MILLISLLRFIFIIILVAGCKHIDTKQAWSGKLYIGDSAHSAIVRSQAGESISCNDKQFDSMICMSTADYKNLFTGYIDARAKCLDEPAQPAAQKN